MLTVWADGFLFLWKGNSKTFLCCHHPNARMETIKLEEKSDVLAFL